MSTTAHAAKSPAEQIARLEAHLASAYRSIDRAKQRAEDAERDLEEARAEHARDLNASQGREDELREQLNAANAELTALRAAAASPAPVRGKPWIDREPDGWIEPSEPPAIAADPAATVTRSAAPARPRPPRPRKPRPVGQPVPTYAFQV